MIFESQVHTFQDLVNSLMIFPVPDEKKIPQSELQVTASSEVIGWNLEPCGGMHFCRRRVRFSIFVFFQVRREQVLDQEWGTV
jgi:hypothetical protein